MTVGLDTSVLIRLLTGEPRDLAVLALEALSEYQEKGERILVSDWVLAEAYYALQHHFGAPKKDVLETLKSFLATPGIEGLGEAASILALPRLESAKPGFIDRVIHRTYLQSGADEMITFEKSASRLPRARVLAR